MPRQFMYHRLEASRRDDLTAALTMYLGLRGHVFRPDGIYGVVNHQDKASFVPPQLDGLNAWSCLPTTPAGPLSALQYELSTSYGLTSS